MKKQNGGGGQYTNPYFQILQITSRKKLRKNSLYNKALFIGPLFVRFGGFYNPNRISCGRVN
jgi:hypothetical protein